MSFAVIDDDRWHSFTLDARVIREVFPDIKHLQAFQLHTRENGKSGHEFWVDDFVIGAQERDE